jgi:hypothetical protein
MCVILNGFRDRLLGSADLTPLHFCLWSWTNSEAYKRKVDTQDELRARILVAAARIKIREDKLRRKTRDLCIRVAKCIEAYGRIFENFL